MNRSTPQKESLHHTPVITTIEDFNTGWNNNMSAGREDSIQAFDDHSRSHLEGDDSYLQKDSLPVPLSNIH